MYVFVCVHACTRGAPVWLLVVTVPGLGGCPGWGIPESGWWGRYTKR